MLRKAEEYEQNHNFISHSAWLVNDAPNDTLCDSVQGKNHSARVTRQWVGTRVRVGPRMRSSSICEIKLQNIAVTQTYLVRKSGNETMSPT